MPQDEQAPKPEVTARGDVPIAVPDFYADNLTLGMGYSGINILFQRTDIQGSPPIPTVIVRCSPQTAVLLGGLIRKVMREYEKQFGPFGVPRDLMERLGLSEADL
jgi:hypothetical protein